MTDLRFVEGPTVDGRWEATVDDVRVAFPGWATRASVETRLRQMASACERVHDKGARFADFLLRQITGVSPAATAYAIPFPMLQYGSIPTPLLGTAYETLGMPLVMAMEIDRARLGIDADPRVGVQITHYGLTISLAARKTSLARIDDATRDVGRAIARLKRQHDADGAIVARGVVWSRFARTCAALLTPDDRRTLHRDVDARETEVMSRPETLGSTFSRRHACADGGARVDFRMGSSLEVQATLSFEGVSINGGGMTLRLPLPDAAIAALPGRAATDAVDHASLRGRTIRTVRRELDLVHVTLEPLVA